VHDSLDTVLLLLASAVGVVVMCRMFRLPALIGYLVVGVLIGPHALGWVADSPETHALGEFGVVFLMFSIGLEFSLPRLLSMRRVVFGLGAAQVALSTLLVIAAAVALGLGWRTGLALGGALAMSSTAILAKMLADRLELGSQHGRTIIGVLLFQDLAVVPFLILVPALGSSAEQLAYSLAIAVLKAGALLALILFLGKRVMRPWFHVVASRRSPELFMLNVLLFTLGMAWVTRQLDLSLALGAFLAGMLISETEYRHQVELDIRPFQDVLLGLFFVTIGMQLNLAEVARAWYWVLALLSALALVKSSMIAGLARLFGADPGTAIRSGLALGIAGEFGLVLLSEAGQASLLSAEARQIVLAALVLSMLVGPFVIERSEHLVRGLSSADWMYRAMALQSIAAQTMGAEQHIILCGYGRTGQNLARFLEQEGIRIIALDLDPQRVKEAATAGESVVFGDAARREVLMAAGLARAKGLVVTYADTNSALKILHHVHELRPDLPVVVRTMDDTDIERLREAGAAEVVSEVMEGSLMLASHALLLVGVPFNRVLRRIRQTREQRYGLFKGFFPGASDETGEHRDRLQLRLHSVSITPGAWAQGKRLRELDLGALRVEVTAVRRHRVRSAAPGPETELAAGDVVVLRGSEEGLAAAEMRLLGG
jgi:CPA2 family monovalent cation:H+ antiporter-2